MSKSKEKNNNSFYELIKTLFYAGTIAVVFRSILFEPFNIPSGSMIPTLLVGDYLFVSKYSYGYSRYSFPFGILPIKDRLIYNVPQRGDIIVFRKPGDEQVDYIKRLIGLPGDEIQFINGDLYINQKIVKKRVTQIPNKIRCGKFTLETNSFIEWNILSIASSFSLKNFFQTLLVLDLSFQE